MKWDALEPTQATHNGGPDVDARSVMTAGVQAGDSGEINPPEGLATLYATDYQPKLAYKLVRTDLAFGGPPLVLRRIPQKPRS